MKVRLLMTVLAVIEMAGQAKAKDSLDERSSNVTVYVHVDFNETPLAISRAERIASGMFFQAGVRIRWRSGAPKDDRGTQLILIDVTSNTPEAVNPGAMGYAQPYEVAHIRIFWDRVNAAGGPALVGPLLAHVLVHEITHVLEGFNHHSQAGVMKARWTLEDIEAMAENPLPFDPYDLILIQSGLAHRQSYLRQRSPKQSPV